MMRNIQRKIVVVLKGLMRILSKNLINRIFINKLFFVSDEYNENIGTIYKGCSKESSIRFRFKERFKKKNGVVFVSDISLFMEAI